MLNKNQLNVFLDKKYLKKNVFFHLNCCVIFIAVFIISYILSQFYNDGDQRNYILVYNTLPTMNITEGKAFYTKFLTSSELVHFTLVSFFSRIVEKEIFVSLFNSILAYGAMILFRKWKIKFTVSAITVLTNYYIYILYLPAERLKFGFLFLIFALLYVDNRKKFLVFSVLSMNAHFQMIIQYSSLLFEFIFSKLKLLIFEMKLSLPLLGALIVPLIIFIAFPDHFFHKINHFISNSNGISEIYKGLIFFVGAFIYSKDKKQTIFLFIPLIIAAYFLGGSRVNMIIYFVFLYFTFPVNNGFNLAVIVSTLYFGYKNILFLNKVVLYGNGFY